MRDTRTGSTALLVESFMQSSITFVSGCFKGSLNGQSCKTSPLAKFSRGSTSTRPRLDE